MKSFDVRLTDEVARELLEKVKALGMTTGQFIAACVCSQVVAPEDFPRAAKECEEANRCAK